jgi:hypothetical protein
MCTLATLSPPFSLQICVLWPLHPHLSVHKYVYFGHFIPTFQFTNMCTLATSSLHSVHKYVYFGHFISTFSAQIRVLRPLKLNQLQCCFLFTSLVIFEEGQAKSDTNILQINFILNRYRPFVLISAMFCKEHKKGTLRCNLRKPFVLIWRYFTLLQWCL